MSTYTAQHKAYYERNKERIKVKTKENEKKWIQTPKGQYSIQKRKAKQRKIEWLLTFEEWWDIWQKSGKWEERGDTSQKYCMCRTGDVGPYSVDNVRIDTFGNNTKECMSLRYK